jgi:oxaloacetate decarboxylase alpha subunit
MAPLHLIDTTFRDGQQCNWATRMSTAAMLPAAEDLDRAGFGAIEVIGAVQFDAAVRYLSENPWDRLRQLRTRITRTPMQAVIRSSCILGFEPQHEDINRLWVERLIANGCTRFVAFDGLHDLDNVVPALLHAKSLGAMTTGWLTFSDSPIHTDELYAQKAREFIDRADVDALLIEDASGVLTPERLRTLVPAIRAEIGEMSLGLHSHGVVGLPQRSYLAAAELGVDNLYTCVPPVADSNAPPSVLTTLRNLRATGHAVDMDIASLERVSHHLDQVSIAEGRPRGRVMDFDAAAVGHQVPGGVMSNLEAQLDQVGLHHKLPEVLEECARVRADLGWPIQVTPFAQFIGVQATLNVINGDRYAVVPDEVKKYALGHYGKPLAPVVPNVLDRILENGSAYIQEPSKNLEPVLPGLRTKYLDLNDETRMLRYFFDGAMVDRMERGVERSTILRTPIVAAMELACSGRNVSRVVLDKGDFHLELRKRPGT